VNPEAQYGLWVLVCTFAAGLFAGYGWALYRAAGWVERMRAWAGKVVESNETEAGACSD
jgi:hypothetical protein